MGVVPLSDNIVEVTPADKQVVVIPEEKLLSVSAPGPPGPQGAIGPAGGDVIVYDRNGVPANPWVIDHGLGRLVHVTVVLDSGEEIFPGIDQSDPNILTISFGVPTSGKALVG
jgi:hypothetical protein